MPTILKDKALEGSTYGIKVSFGIKTDPDDAVATPFTPKAGLKWSLTDKEGNIINGKENEPLSPGESVYVVLSGGDLALTGGPTRRYVTVEGTFDSVLGNDLPLTEEVSFPITNLRGVP